MEVDDAHISVRFRNGPHTIFLFLDALAPFSNVTDELLEVLRERYPSGLSTSTASPDDKKPLGDEHSIVYGVLATPNDPSNGWKKLKLGDRASYTPTKLGLKDNSVVAFTFVESSDDDEEEAEVEFDVEWPQEDEEMYEQQA